MCAVKSRWCARCAKRLSINSGTWCDRCHRKVVSELKKREKLPVGGQVAIPLRLIKVEKDEDAFTIRKWFQETFRRYLGWYSSHDRQPSYIVEESPANENGVRALEDAPGELEKDS